MALQCSIRRWHNAKWFVWESQAGEKSRVCCHKRFRSAVPTAESRREDARILVGVRKDRENLSRIHWSVHLERGVSFGEAKKRIRNKIPLDEGGSTFLSAVLLILDSERVKILSVLVKVLLSFLRKNAKFILFDLAEQCEAAAVSLST